MLRNLVLVMVWISGPQWCPGQPTDAPWTAAIFSADGQTVFAGSQAGVVEFEWPQMNPRRTYLVPVENVHDLLLATDQSTLLIAGGTPGESGRVVELHLTTGHSQSLDVGEDVVLRVQLTNSEKQLILATAQSVCYVLDRKTRRIEQQFGGHSGAVLALQRISDSLVVSAGTDQTLQLWNPVDGRSKRTMNHHLAAVNDLVTLKTTGGAAGTSDGTDSPLLLASTGDDRTVRLWYPETGRMLRFVKLPHISRSLAFSVDGTRLYAGCDDGTVWILDVPTLRILADTPTPYGRIFVLARHPSSDDLLVAGQKGLGFTKGVRNQ